MNIQLRLFSLLILGLLISSCTQEVDNTETANFNSEIPKMKNTSNTAATTWNETVFKVVEQMPLFGDCNTKACSDEKLINYLYEILDYPDEARKAGIEGKVYVQFIINQDGYISDINVARGTGSSLDQAALKAVRDINLLRTAFQPGKQRGQAVRVMYTLPISFRMEK